jgi:hypothetical protein
MNVYLVTGERDYEPSTILGVAATLELAKAIGDAHAIADSWDDDAADSIPTDWVGYDHFDGSFLPLTRHTYNSIDIETRKVLA